MRVPALLALFGTLVAWIGLIRLVPEVIRDNRDQPSTQFQHGKQNVDGKYNVGQHTLWAAGRRPHWRSQTARLEMAITD
jgi:hypothetical protein